MAVEIGMGTDLHGADYTKAACRALADALWHNSLSVARAFGLERDHMMVRVTIGVARPDAVDKAAVAKVLPYGRSEVTVVTGGLDVPHPDGASHTVMASAIAAVYLDLEENET
ncbi:MAG: Lin0512 family protein [Burkholderiaceae bacterium]